MFSTTITVFAAVMVFLFLNFPLFMLRSYFIVTLCSRPEPWYIKPCKEETRRKV